MLAYVKGVQRQEIRKGVACVKHQRMAGSNLGIIKHFLLG
jgi:isocitrate lyase